MNPLKPFPVAVQSVFLIASFSLVSFLIPRTDFYSFIACYTVSFLAYFYLCRQKIELRNILLIGILARTTFIFTTPEYSDDVYRFLWDGRLWIQGENPFEHIPQYYLSNRQDLIGLTELYEQLNSKNYFAVYPPINQFIFGLSAWIAPTGFFKGQLVLKLVMIAGELLAFYYGVKLLRIFGQQPERIAWYFLNPLVILEVTGNLHFEGLMVTFLLMAFYHLKTNRWAISALFMAFAICTKLLPILYLPLLIPVLGIKKSLQYLILVAAVCFLLFLPFLNIELLLHIFSSIDLYFQSFQFNSFLYNILLDLLGPASKPWLAILLALFPALLVFRYIFMPSNIKNFLKRSLVVHSVYYFFAAVVHPWYLVTLLALNLFVRFRFVVVWSYVIGLSYFTYRTLPYNESSFLIALEYTAVGVWSLLDYFRFSKPSKLTGA